MYLCNVEYFGLGHVSFNGIGPYPVTMWKEFPVPGAGRAEWRLLDYQRKIDLVRVFVIDGHFLVAYDGYASVSKKSERGLNERMYGLHAWEWDLLLLT